MDPGEIDAIVQRLLADPHDEEALAYAHHAGQADPKSYAVLLERLGNESREPAVSAHWLSEAANVWLATLGDAHRAARVLMTAIDRDPTQSVAAERLAQLYREKNDVKALAALLDRRTKSLAPLLPSNPELRPELAALHEELGKLWSESPLAQPKKAIEHFRRAIDLDPQSQLAIFSARELLKSQGQWEEAFALYEPELALEQDPARRAAILRDEALARRAGNDLAGATRALGRARQLDDQDPGLQQELAQTVLDRVLAGESVPGSERTLAVELLVGLAEIYDGEHGLAYSAGALDIEPGHDRAAQLLTYYARTLQREGELAQRYLAYLGANPAGSMAAEARHFLAASYEQAGQVEHAIEILEPLRAAGDPDAIAKLGELTSSTKRPSARMTASPAAPPETPASWSEPAPEAPRVLEGSFTGRGPLTPDRLQGVLDAAQMLSGKGKKTEAYAKYKEVLDADPAHPEALAWVEDYLRSKRDYATLKDVLLASVRAISGGRDTLETRRERLREVAGLCEGNLRDTDGAVGAYKQLLALDRADESARQALTRLLEKTSRWDDLANLLEQEATAASDIDTKIGLEKKLAKLHEDKRRDLTGAAEAWSRIARLVPEDDRAVQAASKLYEKAGDLKRAEEVISDHIAGIEDVVARGQLLEKLGELREQLSDPSGAGDAYVEAADAQKSPRLWEAAERAFSAAERWERAASAACQRAQLEGDPKHEAAHYARAAELYFRAGDAGEGIARLEQASDLDPGADDYATMLSERYTETGEHEKLIGLLVKRGDRISDRQKRVSLRRQAAQLASSRGGETERARELWLKVLEDGDDREALDKLVDYAVEREDHTEAATLLRRLQNIAVDKADKARIALREAELLADGVGDVDTALARYEAVLADLDPTCRPALQAIADLQESRDNLPAAADALERELKLVADPKERGQIAARLARLYEQIGDPRQAIRALEIVRKADGEDYDALERLCNLCQQTEQWDRVAELLAQRIEIEGDEDEAARMTLELAQILSDRLDRGDEALAALTELADLGHQPLRDAYVELGDRLGWKGIVASKLLEWWFDTKSSPERTSALRGAFDRFNEVGRDQDAARVAIEVIRAKGADAELAQRLEQLAVKMNDEDALGLAQDLLVQSKGGLERASEIVRQAEVRVHAGLSRADALAHGESGLAGVPPTEAEPLLDRLALLAEKSSDVVDLYERQVSRAKAPTDRVRALGRAAQVAAAKGQMDRARTFFELALAGVPTEETLQTLEELAASGDRASGGERLRRALCQGLTTSGGGARDGGRTRAALLRRAALIAHRDLRDVDQAFAWMGDALVAFVDPSTLDALEELAAEVGDLRRAESALSHALGEVFDGPLVRQLLSRRAKLRLEKQGDRAGAAADLKKLHDLSPNDANVLEQLSSLLGDLGDYRGMVQLYEDQILRGKDVTTRAELARKVARMWEEQLQDPREAADAWRRVLRMKAGDPEATAGLERAKSNMLKKPEPGAGPEQYAPPKPPAPSTKTPAAPVEAVRELRAATRDVVPNTAQFVAALIDTSETPAVRERATPPPIPGEPRATEPVDRVVHELTTNPQLPKPDLLSDSDLVVEESATDMGQGLSDSLSSTAEHSAADVSERVDDFNDNEHTEYRPFAIPDPNVVEVDDLAEEITDEEDEDKPLYPRG